MMGADWPLVCRICRREWWTWPDHYRCERTCEKAWTMGWIRK